MKYTKVIITSLLIAMFFNCEKHQNDYRNAFIGRWYFVTITSRWNIVLWDGAAFDTIKYHGKIDYGSNKDEILVNNSCENYFTLKIKWNGEIIEKDGYSGSFIGKDSLYIGKYSGSLGVGESESISGKRE